MIGIHEAGYCFDYLIDSKRTSRLGCNPIDYQLHVNLQTYRDTQCHLFLYGESNRASGNDLLTKHIDVLHEAFRVSKLANPFTIQAMVALVAYIESCLDTTRHGFSLATLFSFVRSQIGSASVGPIGVA